MEGFRETGRSNYTIFGKCRAAMSDLAKGIAHEAGQPIINIRYAIQSHKQIFENNPSKGNILKVFNSIDDVVATMARFVLPLPKIMANEKDETS